MIYKFGDIANNVTEKRSPKPEDSQNYIGLEHLDSGSLYVNRYGIDVELKGDKLVMHKGDVLLGKRNAYLRRAAIAPHDGLFSAHGMILRPKDVIASEFFPFFIASDKFFDDVIRISVGGLSPTVNWKDLKELEAEKLWAAYEVKQSYLKMIAATEEMVKAQFIEMFGDPLLNNKGWPIMTLGASTKAIVGGECLNGTQRQKEHGEKAVLKVSAVSWGYFNENEYKVLNDVTSVKKGLYPCKGDLLFCRANTPENVGGTALIDKDYPDLYLPDKIWKIIPNDDLTTLYLKHYMSNKNIRVLISNMASGTSNSMYNISMSKLRTLPVLIPPIALQYQFETIYRQADKSISELRKSVDAIDKVIRSLINENL